MLLLQKDHPLEQLLLVHEYVHHFSHRIGIDTIILPKENKKNVDEIPSSIKGKLNLIFADNVEEVLQNALIGVDKSDN